MKCSDVNPQKMGMMGTKNSTLETLCCWKLLVGDSQVLPHLDDWNYSVQTWNRNIWAIGDSDPCQHPHPCLFRNKAKEPESHEQQQNGMHQGPKVRHGHTMRLSKVKDHAHRRRAHHITQHTWHRRLWSLIYFNHFTLRALHGMPWEFPQKPPALPRPKAEPRNAERWGSWKKNAEKMVSRLQGNILPKLMW